MKKYVLVKYFFEKNKVAIILMGLLLFVAIYILNWVQGVYNYRMRYVNTLEDYAGDGDLFMQYQSWLDQERIKEILDEVSALPGVEYVLYNITTYWTDENGKDYKICFLSKGLEAKLDLKTSINEYSNENIIECIACFGVANVGDQLRLRLTGDEDSLSCDNESLNFVVKGVTDSDFLYPVFDLSGSAGTLCASSLLYTPDVLFVSGQSFLDYIGEENLYYDTNCYVIYKQTATEDEKNQARSVIEEHGDYQRIADIIENSKSTEIDQIKKIIIIPRVMLGVITFACFTMILLTMQTKLEEYSVFYLCGHSKPRILIMSFFCISLVMVVPCIINVLIILFSDTISRITGIFWGTVIYTTNQLFFVIVYLVVMLFLAAITEFLVLAKMSPIDMYRRMTG